MRSPPCGSGSRCSKDFERFPTDAKPLSDRVLSCGQQNPMELVQVEVNLLKDPGEHVAFPAKPGDQVDSAQPPLGGQLPHRTPGCLGSHRRPVRRGAGRRVPTTPAPACSSVHQDSEAVRSPAPRSPAAPATPDSGKGASLLPAPCSGLGRA